MAKQQTDDELNLRRKARRRLIGAVALTLAVVVILPMVLDREPKISGKDIDLSIPDPNRAGKFVPRVAVSDSASPSAGSAVAAAPAVAPVQPDAAKPVAAPAQQKKEAPAKAQPAAKESAETGNTAQPVSAEGFVAQVGAYSNQDTAKQELKKLKQWGFKAYTEKVGDKMRVRVGPYPDRDKAEIAGHQLEKHGYHPVIVSAK
jgi:DedD protein